MNVKLAARVFSLSISKVLSTYGPPDAAGTADICLLLDTFFDIMNVENVIAHQSERKPDLVPFNPINDLRFSWPQSVFSQYFKDWLHLGGRVTLHSKIGKKMFISWQTNVGLNLTVNSITKAVYYLLQHEVNYGQTVWSSTICRSSNR